MGPKSIQDVAPPSQATNSPAEPPVAPEIVADIPVRAPGQQPASDDQASQPKDNGPQTTAFANPLSAAVKEDKQKPKTNAGKSQPTLAIAVALLAVICLAAGAYLKFFNGS